MPDGGSPDRQAQPEMVIIDDPEERTALERKWDEEELQKEKEEILEELNGEWIPLPNHNPNCSKCYGRGHQGKAKVGLKSGGFAYTFVACSKCGKDSREFMNLFTGKLRKF
jgi:hypothetical protein